MNYTDYLRRHKDKANRNLTASRQGNTEALTANRNTAANRDTNRKKPTRKDSKTNTTTSKTTVDNSRIINNNIPSTPHTTKILTDSETME